MIEGIDPAKVPRHVGCVMDGNGRWAEQFGLPRTEGHAAGEQALLDTVYGALDLGISWLTLYAFSTENWLRPESEVSGLMKLLSQFIDSELDEIHKNDIKFNIIGEADRLPTFVRNKIQAALERTSNNRTMVLTVALSYGGRQDIVSAALKVHDALMTGKLTREDISEGIFASYLNTVSLPDPDLLIRTGGEIRISNFLLWQLAYAELYFTDQLRPTLPL